MLYDGKVWAAQNAMWIWVYDRFGPKLGYINFGYRELDLPAHYEVQVDMF